LTETVLLEHFESMLSVHPYQNMHDFRLLPWSIWELCSSGLLCSESNIFYITDAISCSFTCNLRFALLNFSRASASHSICSSGVGENLMKCPWMTQHYFPTSFADITLARNLCILGLLDKLTGRVLNF